MINDETSPEANVQETLESEELAEVKGGAILKAPLASIVRIDISQLKQRLDLAGLTAYHVKDSGPTWVNSPRNFDFGSIVLPASRVF